MSLTWTTELEAVNTMLEVIGESPISSLEVSGLADAAMAKSILAKTSRAVQMRGWDFNTDTDFSLARDENSKIPVPLDALRIDATTEPHIVQRAGFLWDLANHTNIFAQELRCDIVRYFAFEELPEAAREYIAIRAARKFQKRVQGDETVDFFTHQDELDAWRDMTDADSETADRSMLNDFTLYNTVRKGRR